MNKKQPQPTHKKDIKVQFRCTEIQFNKMKNRARLHNKPSLSAFIIDQTLYSPARGYVKPDHAKR